MAKFQVYEVQVVSRLTMFVYEVDAATQAEAVQAVRDGETHAVPERVKEYDEEYGVSGFGESPEDAHHEFNAATGGEA